MALCLKVTYRFQSQVFRFSGCSLDCGYSYTTKGRNTDIMLNFISFVTVHSLVAVVRVLMVGNELMGRLVAMISGRIVSDTAW